MPDDLLTPAADDTDRAWRRLRALRIGEQLGWYDYLAGDRRNGKYALRLDGNVTRVLHREALFSRAYGELRRDEVLPWLIGFAASQGNPYLFDAMPPAPPTVDATEAARLLGLSAVAVNVRVMSGKLNPLYIARRERRFLTAELAAATGGPEERAAWDRVRADLPPTIRLDQVSINEAPSPDPLPVALAVAETPRCIDALMRGADLQFWRYVHGGQDTYTVELGGKLLRLPSLAVLPWAWGYADGLGRGEEMAYR